MRSILFSLSKAGFVSSLALSVLHAQEETIADIPATELSHDVPELGGAAAATEERKPREVPIMFRDDAFLDDSHANQELGINIYTAPSISKIFAQLDGLPTIPDEYVLRKRPEHLPMVVGKLSLELGFLLADGFIAVRSGRMNDIKPIALDLSRYGKALGVGERMNAHTAGLLEQAEKGLLKQFKETLSATQVDVNEELRSLRDPDLSNLIALGGWVRALTASCAALEGDYTPAKAQVIFYPDAPEYFAETVTGLNPQTALSINSPLILKELAAIQKLMTLSPESPQPSLEKIKAMREAAERLSEMFVGKSYKY